MNQFSETIKQFFAPLNPAQRIMFIGLTVAIVVFVGGMFYWALKPDYTLLFGSLQSESAQEVTHELEERGVDYEVRDNGRSVYVRNDKVDELRIQLAPLGAPQSDMKGYELFDTNSLGMTDFMQQLNNKRALEGELSRSVNSLSQVETSRIHLVQPERTPFRETSVDASASVILTLKRGKKLSQKHVEGITALIAGSVEGLDATNVTIVDQAGNRLSDGLEGDAEFTSGSRQMQMRQKAEQYLSTQGQSMLDRVFGPGNSVLRVSVEQNFDSIVRESDVIDPESRTIISEERSSEVNNNENNQLVPIDEFTPMENRGETALLSANDNEVTRRTRNYEINRTREVFREAQGKVKRMTASVLINEKQVMREGEDGQQVMASEPYSEQELEEYKEVIRLALGMQPERGDEITIEQTRFWNPEGEDSPGGWSQPLHWTDFLRWGLIALSFIAIVALLYSIKKRMGTQNQIMLGLPGKGKEILLEGDGTQSGPRLQGGQEAGKQLEGSKPRQLEENSYNLDKIKDFVELKPSEAAQVVRVLLNSDKE